MLKITLSCYKSIKVYGYIPSNTAHCHKLPKLVKFFQFFYFIVIFYTPFAYILFKSKLPDERVAERPQYSNKNKNDIER